MKNNLSTVKLTKQIAILVAIMLVIIILGSVFFRIKHQVLPIESDLDISVKVAVINGCGYTGIARDVKEILIDKYNKNIDVIGWENGSKFIYDKTILVMVKDDQIKLDYMRELTGIKRRTFALDENAQEDVQIILGKDYPQYFKKE